MYRAVCKETRRVYDDVEVYPGQKLIIKHELGGMIELRFSQIRLYLKINNEWEEINTDTFKRDSETMQLSNPLKKSGYDYKGFNYFALRK